MKFVWMLTMAAMTALLCGCEAIEDAWNESTSKDDDSGFSFFGEPYTPKYVIAFFEEVRYPRAGELEQEVTTFDGRKLWINTNQLMSSKHIREVKLEQRIDQPDRYDLKLRLTESGCRIWTLMALKYQDEKVALFLDNHYIGSFNPEPLADEDAEWVAIRYPLDEVTARGVEKYARKNFKNYNPSKL